MKNKGFTIIEMIVTIAVFSIILLLFSIFVSRGFNSYRVQNEITEEQSKISTILKNFESTTRAATEILTAGPTELKFYRFYDLNPNSIPTQVRYFIDGNSLKLGLTQPQGTAPNITYPQNMEVVSLIITNVANPTAIFQYYNSINNLIAQPVIISNVRMVMMTMSLDKDPNAAPAAVSESTQVSLRNLKDNL